LREVVFESLLSLRIMIETDNVDLSQFFAIRFAQIDCELDFPGYYVQTVPGDKDLFRLVKISSLIYKERRSEFY
jgi:hypothetical protein